MGCNSTSGLSLPPPYLGLGLRGAGATATGAPLLCSLSLLLSLPSSLLLLSLPLLWPCVRLWSVYCRSIRSSEGDQRNRNFSFSRSSGSASDGGPDDSAAASESDDVAKLTLPLEPFRFRLLSLSPCVRGRECTRASGLKGALRHDLIPFGAAYRPRT